MLCKPSPPPHPTSAPRELAQWQTSNRGGQPEPVASGLFPTCEMGERRTSPRFPRQPRKLQQAPSRATRRHQAISGDSGFKEQEPTAGHRRGSSPKEAQERRLGAAVRPGRGLALLGATTGRRRGLPRGGPPRAPGTAPGHRSSGAPLPPGRRAERVMRPRFPCPEPRGPGVTSPAAPPGAGPVPWALRGARGRRRRASVSLPGPARLRPRGPTARPGAHRQARHDLDRAAVAEVPSGLRRRLGHGRRRLLRAARPPRAAPAAGRLLLPRRPTRPRTLTHGTHGTHSVGRSGARGSGTGGAHGGWRPGRRWPPRGKLGPRASRSGRRAGGRVRQRGGAEPPWRPGSGAGRGAGPERHEVELLFPKPAPFHPYFSYLKSHCVPSLSH